MLLKLILFESIIYIPDPYTSLVYLDIKLFTYTSLDSSKNIIGIMLN